MTVEINVPLSGCTFSDPAKIGYVEGRQKVALLADTDIDQCTGGTASASSIYDTWRNADKAFDDIKSSCWLTAYGQTAGWIKYDFGAGNEKIIRRLSIARYGIGGNYSPYNSADADRMPKDFTIQGSNDNTNWTTLYTAANERNWKDIDIRYYNFPENSTAYRYYRVNITAVNGGSYISISEIEMFLSLIYSTSGETAALLQIDLGMVRSINEADLLIPCNTDEEPGTVQARRRLDNGSWSAFQDLILVSDYEYAFALTGTFNCRYLDIGLRLNSYDGLKSCSASRPKIKGIVIEPFLLPIETMDISTKYEVIDISTEYEVVEI